MPQMHGRYLVWGGAMSALLAAESVGLGLLGLLVATIAAMGMITNQYTFEPSWDPENWNRLSAIRPHLGWMLVLIGAIVLYVAAVPRTLLRPRPRMLHGFPVVPAAATPIVFGEIESSVDQPHAIAP
jgi:hypothetical protein